MKTLTRLYRLENMWGGGLYREEPNQGYHICKVDTYDVELYSDGLRREIEYVTHGGEQRVHRTDVVDYSSGQDYEAEGQICSQINLPFKDAPIIHWGTQFELPELDMSSSMIQSITSRMPRFDSVFDPPSPQLTLDVTRPAEVVKFCLQSGDPFTLADVLELRQNGVADERLVRRAGNRPMPQVEGFPEDFRGKYWFAFESLQALSEWVDGIAPGECLQAGAAISVIDVKKVIKGRKQAIYRPCDIVKSFTIVNTGLYELAGKPKSKKHTTLF